MRLLLLVVAALSFGTPALARSSQLLVPCATISPQAVTTVPPPFDGSMKLFCYNITGQGLMPPAVVHWVQGNNSMDLVSMDDRFGPNGPTGISTTWYVSLTPRKISPADDAALRRVLSQEVKSSFIDGAGIIELDAATSVGEVKQEFIISPADPADTDGIKLLVECHQFCQGSNEPWILAIVPDSLK